MNRKLLTLLFILLACRSGLRAQTPNYYMLETKAAAYKELINDTALKGAFTNPTATWFLDNLKGEKFSLFDKDYVIDNVKQFVVFSNNGFMRVEDDTTFIVVDAAFTYADSIDATTKVSYVVEGISGNRIVKVQWKNLRLSNGTPDNYLNYQIWLYQKTGVFEVYYGPSDKNASGYTVSTGPNIGLFYSLKTFTKMMEKIWLYGNPGSYDIDSSKTVVFKSVNGIPPNGTLLRYVPRKVAAGINTVGSNSIRVYPNPSSSQVTIALKESLTAPAMAVLYDMQGRKVMEQPVESGVQQVILPVAHIAGGLYELKIDVRGELLVCKVEVKH